MSLNRSGQRFAYLDFLRILAAFLVIVNHTNSLVFEKLTPANFTWWLSIAWYYLSKIAVPLFVMISGACLLPRQDTYPRAFGRFLRALAVLVLFSYAYYLINLWQSGWAWPKALDILGFLYAIWQTRITDSFWYLYFYLGLMLMLPILQRMASAMKQRDLNYLMVVCFSIFAVWPLLTHYLPALALPEYFDLSMLGVFIGLFFAGHAIHTYTGRSSRTVCVLGILATLAASIWLTRLEYGQVASGAKYWFMDERSAPSIFVILCAMAMMLLFKQGFAAHEPRSDASIRRWAALGGCAFGIYLLQDLAIAQTRYRFFVPMSGVINPLLAALIWEVGVFLITFAVAWLLRHIPLLGKLL